jgi:hypothetical protein
MRSSERVEQVDHDAWVRADGSPAQPLVPDAASARYFQAARAGSSCMLSSQFLFSVYIGEVDRPVHYSKRGIEQCGVENGARRAQHIAAAIAARVSRSAATKTRSSP